MNKIFAFLILPLFGISLVNAQDKHLIDSLELKIKAFDVKKAKSKIKDGTSYDTTKADLLYELGRAFKGTGDEKQLNYANACLTLSQKIGYKKGIAN